jgi:hypothetical protein
LVTDPRSFYGKPGRRVFTIYERRIGQRNIQTMKKLFLYLLQKYSRTEANRIQIQKILHEQVCQMYNEQTPFGNVYNHHMEVILANPFIRRLVQENNEQALKMLDNGLHNAYFLALQALKKENTKTITP